MRNQAHIVGLTLDVDHGEVEIGWCEGGCSRQGKRSAFLYSIGRIWYAAAVCCGGLCLAQLLRPVTCTDPTPWRGATFLDLFLWPQHTCEAQGMLVLLWERGRDLKLGELERHS
jgi:hypothetical protein